MPRTKTTSLTEERKNLTGHGSKRKNANSIAILKHRKRKSPRSKRQMRLLKDQQLFNLKDYCADVHRNHESENDGGVHLKASLGALENRFSTLEITDSDSQSPPITSVHGVCTIDQGFNDPGSDCVDCEQHFNCYQNEDLKIRKDGCPNLDDHHIPSPLLYHSKLRRLGRDCFDEWDGRDYFTKPMQQDVQYLHGQPMVNNLITPSMSPRNPPKVLDRGDTHGQDLVPGKMTTDDEIDHILKLWLMFEQNETALMKSQLPPTTGVEQSQVPKAETQQLETISSTISLPTAMVDNKDSKEIGHVSQAIANPCFDVVSATADLDVVESPPIGTKEYEFTMSFSAAPEENHRSKSSATEEGYMTARSSDSDLDWSDDDWDYDWVPVAYREGRHES